MTHPRSLVIAAVAAGSWLLNATPGGFLTVAQRDPFRSPRALRNADVSADGRFVVFESLARLVPADTDDRQDIYVLDRTTSRVTLESDGLSDGLEFSHPRTSGDGRYLVFESRPSVVDTPRADIAVHDRLTGITQVLTKTERNGAPFGWSRNPDISDDGRVVAFSSAATTLTDGPDANGSVEDVYLVQLPAGTITRASLNSAGVQPDRGDSILPSLSADGRWLAFASTAPLDDDPRAPPGSGREVGVRQIYLRDALSGRLSRVTRSANRGRPNGDSSLPAISADGRHVAFVSQASNLVDDDGNRHGDVFLYDRDTDAVSWVSRGADGSSAGGESGAPVVSGNGRFVAFQSDAANLVCVRRCPTDGDDINLLWDVFLFDRTSGRTVRVSEDDLGAWMEPSVGPALDATGQVIAFSSRHAVAAADGGDDFDLFVRALTPPPAVTRKSP